MSFRAVGIYLFVAGAVADRSVCAATLPADFSESAITASINEGTAIAFSPDGKLFALEQDGPVRVYAGSGAGLWTNIAPNSDFFAADPLDVHVANDRGLFGVAFDPDYVSNRHVYFYYTAPSPQVHNRISRITADAAGTQVVPGSRVTLMDLDEAESALHYGGAMHFGPDGKLYVAVGDHGDPQNAQSITSRFGKMLRLNPDPFDPIPDNNPSGITGLPGAPLGVNRAIWAAGLRNPFSFAFHPHTGRMHVNDVGELDYEEINLGAAGANYGWSVTEGPFDTFTFPQFVHPLVAYPRTGSGHPNHPAGLNFQGRAITGGAFYAPPSVTFPSDYVNDYFFADFVDSWIKRYDSTAGAVIDFATGAGSPIDLRVGPDGALYYLSRNAEGFEDGRVFRVQFALAPCPADLSGAGGSNAPDGEVNVFDLFQLLSSWNADGPGAWLAPPAAIVNVFDLFALLSAWGDC